ncbi:MAG: discoidin domain-containing protein, partial [Bacteroidales bacterium]|nr:discoidin domain-containing protein [Bacteroidales bacterium]
NIPTGVYRTTLSGKGLVFDKETTIVVSDGFKANVDVTIAPDSTWWMFYNSPGTMSSGQGTFHTSKMHSKDGIHWIESIHNPIQAFPDNVTVTPHIVWEDEINYQLWHGMGSSFMDLDVYVQRFQLEPEPSISVTSSSVWAVGGLEAQSAHDDNPDTYWSSDHTGGETGRQEWIALDLGESLTLSKVTLTPRVEGICFPVDFEIQSSADGSIWTTITGHTYTGYMNPGNNNPLDFKFSDGLTTQYIRVLATKLADIGGGFFMFQLAEFGYTEKGPEITTSSNWFPEFYGANAIDGNPETYWASNWPGGETDRQEWIARDFGERVTLTKITLTPRVDGAWFPVDFEIQSSGDGSKWATIPGHSYTGYPNPGNADPIDFRFADEGITTQYIRVFASKLSDYESTFYMFHLTEFDYTEKENELTTPAIISLESNLTINPKVFQNEMGIVIELTGLNGVHYIKLFDVTGKQVSSFRSHGGETLLIHNPLQKGLYIVRIQGEGIIHTTKIIFKK